MKEKRGLKLYYCPRDSCPITEEGKMDVCPVLLRGYAVPRCLACEGIVAFPPLSFFLTCMHPLEPTQLALLIHSR